MAIKFSTTVRSARLDAIWTAAGAGACVMRIYSGAAPADCAAAATGTLLATLTLPATEQNAASNGQATIAGGPWSGNAVADGTAGYFRIYDPSNTTCHIQGTAAEGAGDLQFDNATFKNGQNIQITSFTLTDGNA